MRTIQIETEEEKTPEQCNEEINRQLRNAFVRHDPVTGSSSRQEIPSENSGPLLNLEPSAAALLLRRRPTDADDVTNLNAAILKELNDEISTDDEISMIVDAARNESDPENESPAEKNGHETRDKAVRGTRNSSKIIHTAMDPEQGEGATDAVEHHDSDTDSFYNIWGDDDEWTHGNELRDAVRHIHR